MNIQSFAMVGAVYFNLTAYGNLEDANCWVWYLSHLLADMKFMTIFSMLFGAGIALMSGRQATRVQPAAGLHYRRMGWILAIGFLHAHLLWQADTLVAYAMCGFIVFLFRNLSPRVLLVIGVLWFSVASGLSFLSGMSMPYWPEEDAAQFEREVWRPTTADVENEVSTHRGSWLQQLPIRSSEAFYFETFVFLFLFVWMAGGLMLVGMAMFKLGVLTGERSKAFYAALIAIAAIIGAPMIVLDIHRNFQTGWHVCYSFFFGNQVNYWGSPLISLGYVGAIMLISKSDVLQSDLAARSHRPDDSLKLPAPDAGLHISILWPRSWSVRPILTCGADCDRAGCFCTAVDRLVAVAHLFSIRSFRVAVAQPQLLEVTAAIE